MCCTYGADDESLFRIDDYYDAIPSVLLKGAEEAYNLNVEGLNALQQNRFDEALALFRRASELLPNYSDAINNIGVVYFRRGSVGRAQDTWKKVIAFDPEYAIAYYNLGILAFGSSRYDQARSMFEKSLKINRRFVDALVMLAKVELRDNNVKQAYSYVKKAYKIDPSSENVWSTLVYIHILHKDTADAEKILQEHDDNPVALKMLGEIEASRGNTEKSLSYLIRAVALGGDKESRITIARLYLEKHQCDQALKELKEYFANAPNSDADAWLLAGIAAKECNNIDQAREYFQQGLRYFPQDPVIRFNLGHIYFYIHDYDRALSLWQDFSDTLQDPSLYYLRAMSALKTQRITEAVQDIQKAISLDQKAEYYDLYGIILFHQDKKDQAVIQFQKAIALNPSLQSAHLNLALTQKGTEQVNRAIQSLQQVVSRCSTVCIEEKKRLSILYYNNSRYEDAVNILSTIPEQHRDMAVYRHMALCYRAGHEWEKASAVLEKLQKDFIPDKQIRYELAEIYLQAGQYTQAVAQLKNTLSVWGKNPWRLHYQMGYAYMKLMRFDDAVVHLQKSLELNNRCIAARGLLAYVYNELGEKVKARALWEKNLVDDPQNPVLWVNMGLLLEQEGKYEEALEKYQQAITVAPQLKSVYINIGNVYTALQKPTEAIAAFTNALSSDKRMDAAYNIFISAKKNADQRKATEMVHILQREFAHSLHTQRATAEMHLWEADTATALALFESIKEKNENDWYRLVQLYIARQDYERAEAVLQKLPQTPAWNKERLNFQATIAFKKGNYSRAFTLWKEDADSSAGILYNLALAAFYAGELDTVIAIAEELLERVDEQDRAALLRLLGNASVKLNRWQEAVNWYERLMRQQEDAADVPIHYALAVAYSNLDNDDKAQQHFESAKMLNPALYDSLMRQRGNSTYYQTRDSVVIDSLDLRYNEAVTFQENGNDSTAESIYKEILAENPRYYRALNNLGALYGARGDLDRAIDYYKQAVSRRADIVDGYANLVNIYIALHDFDEAEKWLKRGKRRHPHNPLLVQMERKLTDARKLLP